MVTPDLKQQSTKDTTADADPKEDTPMAPAREGHRFRSSIMACLPSMAVELCNAPNKVDASL